MVCQGIPKRLRNEYELGLQEVHLRADRTYNTIADDPGNSFFIPCLSVAETYDRAVGYFSSNIFKIIGIGINQVASRGGRIRLIASPHLSDEDFSRIENGYDMRKAIEVALDREITYLSEEEEKELGFLGRLIAFGHLDIRIAVTQIGSRVGLYHDKFGIFTDAEGSSVVFTGSNNETFQALRVNSETFTVHCSWDGEASERVINRYRSDFEVLWRGQKADVILYQLPDSTVERLVSLARRLPAGFVPESDSVDDTDLPPDAEPRRLDFTERTSQAQPERPKGFFSLPEDLVLRDYQETAIESWYRNQGRGIFEMATGTGKTITALTLVTRFSARFVNNNKPFLALVVCPFTHLVDQWATEIERFNMQPIKCYEVYTKWEGRFRQANNQLNLGGPHVEVLVATIETFRSERFQRILNDVKIPTLLIADEVHNFGSPQIAKILPDNVDYRLGLSATPQRFEDEETDLILSYFGKIIFELDLREAIRIGALCHYRYVPIATFLNAEELERYVHLVREIGKIYAIKGEHGSIDDYEGRLGQLLGERAMVLGHCADKIGAFKEQSEKRRDSMFQLVYCAEGFPPLRSQDKRQIDEIQVFLGTSRNERVAKYVSETKSELRAELLSRFGSGSDLKYLLSMRCLDEGVDIPDARVAYLLASSRNPRQFVQRRGRVLRRPPGGGEKVAEIIDFLSLPPINGIDLTAVEFEVERKLIAGELERAREFASIADNGQEALLEIQRLIDLYKLNLVEEK